MSNVWDLADKYNMTNLKSTLVSHFEKDWPASLEQWDHLDVAMESTYELSRDREATEIDRRAWPEDLLPEPVTAFLFASKVESTEIMGAILYDIFRTSIAIDWDDSSTHTGISNIAPTFKGARWQLSDVHIFRRLRVLQENILNKITSDVRMNFGWEEFDRRGMLGLGKCPPRANCQSHLATAVKDILENSILSLDPLRQYRKLEKFWRAGEKSVLCYTCSTGLENAVKDGRKEMWSMIVKAAQST